MGDPTARALQLLSLLQTRASWSAPELAERTGTTTRTIRRDVERLRELGYPVVATRGSEGGYSLGPGGRLPPLMLGQEEATAVAVALRLAARANLAGLEEPALRALGKLDPVLSTSARAAVRAVTDATDHLGHAPGSTAASVEELIVLAGAIRDRVRVRFGYHDVRGVQTDRDVEPHRLAARYGRWFLFAHDTGRDDWRLFRLDRLADLRVTTFRFSRRDVPDLAARLQAAPAYQGAIDAGATYDVPADRLLARIPPRYGRVEPIGPSSSRLQCSADNLTALAVELLWAAVDLDSIVRDVQPPELADRVARLAAAAGTTYPRAMPKTPGPALPRPTSGDICALILDDHRTMESLLRDLRLGVEDRAATRAAFSAMLVAHSESEERAVYGKLKRTTADVGQHDVEHGHEEHAEGMSALLELLECKGLKTKKFEEALEKVSAYVNHHFAEEELTILGPAIATVTEATRRTIGAEWLGVRGELLDADCGSLENVRAIVERDRAKGLVPDVLPEHPQD